jgi:hypothetical protein
LFGIATNLVSRHRRKEARHYRALARLEVTPAVEGPENRVVAALGSRRQLAQALSRLSQGERDVLLVALGQLGYEEVASALDISSDPADEVADRSRHRLQNHIRGGAAAPRRRIAWLSAGVAVTAAAAVAIAVLPGAPDPAPNTAPGPTSEAPRPATGQEILLAAATVAARAEDGSGAYWHVTIDVPDDTYEYWTKPNGQWWFKGRKTNGAAWELSGPREHAFSLFAVEVTLEQLRALPTDPAALQAWIAEALEHSDARSSKGPFDAEDREMATFYSLISLVSTVPAPPDVRAAAFRALAAYPDVESIGEVPGGQGLVLPNGQRLVVDPATGRVNGTSMYVTADGAIYSLPDPEGARISAEWTDTPPA